MFARFDDRWFDPNNVPFFVVEINWKDSRFMIIF